jgi:cell wall-associated NlpC family hydrolase
MKRIDYSIKYTVYVVLLLSVIGNQSCSSRRASRSEIKVVHEQEAEHPILRKYASWLSVPVSQLKIPELYELLDQWLGTPYKYGGMSRTGIDCSGFVSVVYKSLTNRVIQRSTKDLDKATKVTKKLQEGDLVFFEFDGKVVSHVGMYLHNGKFIHASSSRGVIISDLTSDYYVTRFKHGGPLKIGSLYQLTANRTK